MLLLFLKTVNFVPPLLLPLERLCRCFIFAIGVKQSSMSFAQFCTESDQFVYLTLPNKFKNGPLWCIILSAHQELPKNVHEPKQKNPLKMSMLKSTGRKVFTLKINPLARATHMEQFRNRRGGVKRKNIH